MRVVYLALAAFLILNLGIACRTPAVVAAGCESPASGLVFCPKTPVAADD